MKSSWIITKVYCKQFLTDSVKPTENNIRRIAENKNQAQLLYEHQKFSRKEHHLLQQARASVIGLGPTWYPSSNARDVNDDLTTLALSEN